VIADAARKSKSTTAVTDRRYNQERFCSGFDSFKNKKGRRKIRRPVALNLND
jgi:hypothetical protein